MATTPETASTPDTSTAAVPGHPAGGTASPSALERLTGSLEALPEGHPLRSAGTADAPLLQALTGRVPDRRPVWFMRQAGRSLPEYRALRAGTAMLDSCLDPAMASEITLQPVRRHDVDAAIFFSDIVVPMRVAGVGVDIVPGRGPVLDRPVRTAADVAALPELDDAALDPIREAVARTVAELGATPLIGFAGAPFTVAAYMVEGGPSRDHLLPRTMMHADPAAWRALAEWAARTSGAFLRAQVEAGASAVQLFDSWAGSLSLADYEDHVLEHSAAALAAVADLPVPRIHFGTGTGELLAAMRDAGADAVGVDYRLPLAEASRRLGGRTVLQGNIDPALLAAPWEVLAEHVRDVLRGGAEAPGHVVNLGHGVPPGTDPQVLTDLVAFVHDQPLDGRGAPAATEPEGASR
ncbi:uroporphyrinogen decarboxylase [Kocuria dechangensis]|uniref:Uroporphyrinogen decarboxylase n=1 Tax=Kocuria dechangensis TaxID=1176249 RepID=A0A917GLJ1_9MICC|nr:uroporphyrinogen decarboxylase [Kocuria dechangensis]GGG50185.1 uroporphyrinogen decarboxylase [Kocuria dechangensis]